MGLFGKKKEDPDDKNPALKKLGDVVAKHNENIKKNPDYDQATKDKLITSNMDAYEKAKENFKKRK